VPTIGVDVGGTFTDFVVFDDRRNELMITKVPSTPENPAVAILNGIQVLVDDGLVPGEVDAFLHGTTTTTNALIQLAGANCGLLVTRHMKGVTQVQTQRTIGQRNSYNRSRIVPLIDELNVFEVGERIDRNGDVVVSLDEEDIHAAARLIAERQLQAVAICFMFSFTNPANEHRAKEIIEREVPGCRVFCSVDILPRIREWPRMSTTILNAYLEPVLVEYLDHLASGLVASGVTTKKTFLMESNGGVMPFDAARAGGKAVHTLLSGPAAAVQAARRLASASGIENVITMDLGGTSCDIAFVQGSVALEATEGQVCGYDIYVPMLDIETIGAGGGTIARVEGSGRLRVGPQSAGALPGPAAYGRGGVEATITDADVVLGYLNPEFFLGGKLTLDVERAHSVVEEKVAKPLGMTTVAAASAMVQVNDAHMADAIRVVAARRGVSIMDCRLVGCGGAGPVHVAAVAEELGIREVIVPESPGVFAALGLLCTDVAQDYVQTDIARLDRIDSDTIGRNFKNLEMRAIEEYGAQGFGPEEVRMVREVDARYAGQGFEIRVPVADPTDAQVCDDVTRQFHDIHEVVYGHKAVDEAVELVSYRLRAVVDMPQYQPFVKDGAASPQRTATQRELHFAEGTFTAEVVRRDELTVRQRVAGPAVVEQLDTTTVVPPRWSATLDEFGNLVLRYEDS